MRAHPINAQGGAALLVMLLIIVLGVSIGLVASLNASAIKMAQQNDTSAALAHAKEALITYAVSDANRPGELPCPDVDGDGQSLIGTEYSGNNCVQLIGRLPWKTLRLPDLRDGAGKPLWYAVSDTFHANGTSAINSDTLGALSLSGNQNINNLAAIVFAPGVALCGKSHANNAALDQYLEAITSLSATNALSANRNDDCANNPYNDQLIAISAAHILQPVEQRIAREVKSCLDHYASTQTAHYPWAVPTQNAYLSGVAGNSFGRIPYQNPISNVSVQNFVDALSELQNKIDGCVANDAATIALTVAGSALSNAALALKTAQPTTPAIASSVTMLAKKAGDAAQLNLMCSTIHNNPAANLTQTNLTNASNALASALAMFIATSPSDVVLPCDALFQQAYWQSWKNLVFYQVDANYVPNASATGNGALMINNAGAYRAVVLLARQTLSPQNRRALSNPPSDYLEGGNAHSSTNPATTFVAYRLGEAGFAQVNDLVLCLDGQQTCP